MFQLGWNHCFHVFNQFLIFQHLSFRFHRNVGSLDLTAVDGRDDSMIIGKITYRCVGKPLPVRKHFYKMDDQTSMFGGMTSFV